MSAVINMKQKNIGMDYLKRTAGYISGAVGSYISEAMPMTSDTLGEAKKTVSDVHSTFTHTAQSILPKARELRRQIGFRSISDWFNQKEDEFSSNGFDDADLGFDIPVDDVATEAEVTELAETGNQISRAVIESAHKSVEAQMEATANLTTSMSELTSVVTTGFDQTNKLLSKMLEVLTKNTSTLIEATVANNASVNPEQNMVSSGRFNLRDYKNVITGNIKNSEFGVFATMAPMLLNPDMIKGALTPQELIKSGLSFGLNKMAPNLKKNLKALDDAVNDTIMDSLIRLGENRDFGDRGLIGRIFGLDSSRKDTDTARSKLELKAVPYDTISKESLTSAIPGYLRQILIAVGGPDMVYDYRSRSFKTKDRIRKEFQDASAGGGQLWNASDHVRSKLGTSRFDQMSYDLMINDLSGKTSHGQGRRQVDKFRNYQEAEDYVLKVLYGDQLSSEEDIASAKAFARGLSQIEPGKLHDITTQVAKSNLTRTKRMSQYAKTADQYNVDLSEFTDTVADTAQAIRDAYGRSDLGPKNDETAVIQRGKPETYASKDLSGVNYTNIALYQIFRRLNEGINVFKTGESKKLKKTPYPIWGDDILPRPKDYRPKRPGNQDASEEGNAVIKGLNRDPDEPNLLRNQTLEDGTEEDLTKGQRLSRWGKKRGGDLAHAIFSGDPDQVRAAFSGIVGDVSQVAGDGIKSGISKINDSFGNVSGYLKHKMFGTEYTYTDTDENGNEVTKVVEKNDGGGIFGFVGKKIHSMFDEAKASGSKWFQTVASYFDYGEKDESSDVKSKRKRLINTSVGAMAGAGLLGGPIGLIMGAVAGNALSATGIGEKIKGMLFGRDKNGKAKGILTRVGDSIVDPIRYQFGKSVEHVGNILKKNILGPLSDIGAAIHDRITTAASNTFGKVFGTIGNIILAPFKGIGKALISAAKLPITLAGNLFRGVTGIESGAAGGVMNLTASMIAGKNSTHKIRHEDGTVEEISTREWLKQRRKDRAADVKESKKNSKYSDFKTWQAETHAKDAADRQALRDAMSETVRDYDPERDNPTAEIKEDTSEIKDATTKQAEDTAEIKDSVSEMAKEALTEGSLFTHDKGLHDRVDEIINFLTGKSSGGIKNTTEPSSDHRNESEVTDTLDENRRENEEASIKGSLISGASNLIASGDKVDTEESRITNSMLSEVGKDDADKGKMVKDYQELMAIQDDKKKEGEEKEEKKESVFEKIFESVKDLLPNLAGLAGIATLLYGLFKNGGWSDLLGRIGTGLDKFAGLFKGDDKDGEDAATAGSNSLTAIADIQTPSLWNYAIPGANLYHNERDGAGNRIVNSSATEAKEELLWKMNFRKDLLQQPAAAILSNKYLNKAVELDDLATQQASQGGIINNIRSRFNRSRSEGYLDAAQKQEELSNTTPTSTIRGIGRAFGRVGLQYGLSSTAGSLAGNIATNLGADDETAATVSRVTTAGTSAALTWNTVKSAATGKKGMLDKILDGLSKMLQFIAKKLKLQKGLEKAAGLIDDAVSKILNGVKTKITDKIVDKIIAALSKYGIKASANAVTLGLGYVAGGLSGLASGLCGVEHLFGILPGQADPLMKTVSGIMGTVFGALEWDPAIGWAVAMIDVLDAILIAIPGIGTGMKQFLARIVYQALGGKDNLAEKQEAFQSERQYYADTYGVDMNTATFNDMVNNTGWMDRAWGGKATIGDDGHINYDEAGVVLKSGGIKSWFVGGEKEYDHDSSGAVLRDENGRAVQAVDQYGRGIKKDAKWGDTVGNWFSDVGRWFTGGNTYKTDENGRAIRDENGSLVVESSTKNVFGRAGDAISNWWNGEEITNPDGSTTKTKGFAEAATDTMKNISSTIATPFKEVGSWFKSGANGIKNWWSGTEITNPDGSVTKTEGFADAAKRTLGNVGSAIAQPFKDVGTGIKNWWSGEAELDENGNPIKDENGNAVRKGGFKDWAGSTIGKVGSSFSNIVRGAGAGIKDWVLGEYERDEEGNPLLDEEGKPIRKGGLAGWVQTGLGKFNSAFVEPAKEMISGAKEWVKDKAEWVKDGIQSAKDWIGEKATSMWTTISTPVKEFVDGAKDWAHNTADFIAEGASNAASWIKDKAKNAWTAISTPVKDFAQGASQWVSDKATWLGDKAKDAGAWIKDKATTAWDTISTPVKDMVKGVGDWAKNSAEWVKDKAKDAKDWIADKAKNIFSGITDNIKGMATGIKDWVENKADWVKDGVKDVASWIGDKAKGIWDWITGPIKDLEERGEQDKKDQEYINSHGSGGPVGGPVSAADQMWDRNSQSDSEKTGETTTVKEGGNPLNKAFGISSKYGWRVLDKGNEFHSGIDMYPTDGSRQAEVGARFNGTIKSVENNVSYSGLNTPSQYSAGNYVTYVTDSGMTIKNFHLKKGSIPSNIKPGERVKVGDKLGDMGTTGRSTGPHLHYQMESPNVTDAKGKHTFDPTSSVNGGETMSSFNSYGYTTPTDVTSGTSVISGTDGTSENGDTSALSGLARLLEILKNAGTAFLNKITGGLFGNANANNNSMINTTGSDTGVSTTSSIFYAGSKVNDVEEFLNIARNEIGTKENPDGSNNVKYNTWYYGHAVSGNDYPWCMAFVQWCFDQAGLTLQYKTAGCGSLLNWYKQNAPDRLIARNGDVKPGDIMIFNEHTHTGIVEKVNGDNIITIEGNTSPNEKGSQANGGCVARKTRSRSKIMNFIRAVDFEALANSAKSLSGAGEGAEALWTFLKGMGYNDIAIAGILGCWQNESALRAKRIEGDYLANFPGYDAMMNDQSVMDRWVTEGLHKTPEKNPGYFIGNHAYPGIGFAQWTRGRTKKLVDYAKSVGKSWFDPAAQLGYFQQELSDNYYKKSRPEELNKAGSIEAATRQFCSNFEGYNGDSGIAKRQASARDLYKTYAGKISALPGSDATGGKSEILYPDANEQMTQPVGGPNNANEDGMIDFDGLDANMGKGGPVNDTTSGGSELTTTTYTKPAITPSRKSNQTSSITTGSTSSSAIVPSSQTPKPDATEYPSYTTTTGNDDLSEVVDLLQEVIAHLVAISGNTEMSNTLLDSINAKDFKDQGLRDSLGRLKDVKKNNSYARHGGQMSAGNKRAISALARP